jgi:hypothetical protein
MKAKNLAKLLLATLTLAGAQAAVAKSNISYNYVGLQYFTQDLDDFDCDQDGLNLYGSVEINNDFFARGSFSDVSGNKGCGSQNLTIGAGYRTMFSSQSSIYGVLSFEDISPDNGDGDSGLVLAGGFRTYLSNNLEGKIEVAHHTAFDGDNEIIGGLVYWFNPKLALTGDVSLGSDQTSLAVGARLAF